MPAGFRHGGMFHGFGGGGIGLFGIVVMVLFWAALALLVISVVQHYHHGPRHLHSHGWSHGVGMGTGVGHDATPGPTSSSALTPAIDILRERFARGEVSEEEFTRRLSMLKES